MIGGFLSPELSSMLFTSNIPPLLKIVFIDLLWSRLIATCGSLLFKRNFSALSPHGCFDRSKPQGWLSYPKQSCVAMNDWLCFLLCQRWKEVSGLLGLSFTRASWAEWFCLQTGCHLSFDWYLLTQTSSKFPSRLAMIETDKVITSLLSGSERRVFTAVSCFGKSRQGLGHWLCLLRFSPIAVCIY